MNETILVVAAHPDDEVLGCAGTMARHADEGAHVVVMTMTDGISARGSTDTADIKSRVDELNNAMRVVGVRSWERFDFPDNAMDTTRLLDVVLAVEDMVKKFKPTKIFTHFRHDLNVDHKITHQAVMTACRPLPKSSIREILAYEVLSSTEWSLEGVSAFNPNYFVDIGKYIHIKKAALVAYRSEMRMSPHSRSLAHSDSLAIHRGNSMGLEFAEAFELIRSIR